jgi:hypothetical protein
MLLTGTEIVGQHFRREACPPGFDKGPAAV